MCVSKAPVPVKGDVEFVNCTFDLTANAPADSYNLLNAQTDSNGNINTNITIKGGTVKANSLEGIKIGIASGANVFQFAKDGNGSFTTVQLPESAAAPAGNYTAEGKSVTFVSDTTKNGVTTYKLDVDPCWTPYGTIPSQYADAQAYPFVSFHVNADGTYTFAKADANIFADANSLMVDARNYKTVIYMLIK